MRFKTYLKLYISILIFCFLIFIGSFVLVNMIGYMIIGLARPAMFESKFIDFLIFMGFAAGIDIIIIFIVWLITRTKKKDDKLIRPINGLEFEKENIIQITKKRFGLMKLVTLELNNYKSIHYCFCNDEEINKWLEENDFTDKLVEKEYKVDKTKLIIKSIIMFIALVLVFRDACTSNKTFREREITSSNYSVLASAYNNDYFVNEESIFSFKENKMIKYKSSTVEYKEEYHTSCEPYKIDLYQDYFISSAIVTKWVKTSHNSYSKNEEMKSIKEKFDYKGKSLEIISSKNITYDDPEYKAVEEIRYAIFASDTTEEEKKLISEYAKNNKGKVYSFNVTYGDGTLINDYIYFTFHSYKKTNDARYISKSALCRFKRGTEDVEVVKEFKGARILSFSEKYIMYFDYKTIYRYDIETNKKEKIVKLPSNCDFHVTNNNGIRDFYYSTNGKYYFIDSDFNFIATVNA